MAGRLLATRGAWCCPQHPHEQELKWLKGAHRNNQMFRLFCFVFAEPEAEGWAANVQGAGQPALMFTSLRPACCYFILLWLWGTPSSAQSSLLAGLGGPSTGLELEPGLVCKESARPTAVLFGLWACTFPTWSRRVRMLLRTLIAGSSAQPWTLAPHRDFPPDIVREKLCYLHSSGEKLNPPRPHESLLSPTEVSPLTPHQAHHLDV